MIVQFRLDNRSVSAVYKIELMLPFERLKFVLKLFEITLQITARMRRSIDVFDEYFRSPHSIS